VILVKKALLHHFFKKQHKTSPNRVFRLKPPDPGFWHQIGPQIRNMIVFQAAGSWRQDSDPGARTRAWRQGSRQDSSQGSGWPPPTWYLLASISRRELATHHLGRSVTTASCCLS